MGNPGFAMGRYTIREIRFLLTKSTYMASALPVMLKQGLMCPSTYAEPLQSFSAVFGHIKRIPASVPPFETLSATLPIIPG